MMIKKNNLLFKFGGIIYLQEIFWLLVSRYFLSNEKQFYNRSEFSYLTLTLFVVILIIFWQSFGLLSRIIPKSKGIPVSNKLIKIILYTSISINIFKVILIQDSARYTSGGLTGINGIVYFFANALFIFSTIFLFKLRLHAIDKYKWIKILLILSYAASIDGLAPSLTLLCVIILLYNIGFTNYRNLFIGVASISILFYIGLTSKWKEIPDYLTSEYFLYWIISRFSIQAEQLYMFLHGDSTIKTTFDFISLILHALNQRIDVVFGNNYIPIYPRSVSESIYYDMKNDFNAGSSPGIALGTAYFGPLFIIFQIIIISVTKNIFSGNKLKVGFIVLFPLAFLLKAIYTDSSEYFTLISPTLIYAISVYLGSVIEIKQPKNRYRYSSSESKVTFIKSGYDDQQKVRHPKA